MKHTVLAKKRIYDGFCKLDELTLQYDQFEGGQSKAISRELVDRRPAAAAVLYDPALQNLVFVEQFRVGAQDWLMELVAGVIDEGDTPLSAIEREITEETGLTTGKVIEAHQFYSSPGFLNEYVWLFCAKVDSSNAEGVYGLATENEDIRVHTMAVDDVKQKLFSGYFNNAFTLLGLNWFFLNKADVDQQFAQEA